MSRLKSFAAGAVASVIRLVALILTLWSCAALWIDGPSSRLAAALLALTFAGLSAALFLVVRPLGRAVGGFALLFALVLGWWLSIEPRGDRAWLADVSRAPEATIDGDHVTIRNVRNFDYRSESDYDERWETREYDLSEIRGVDLFLSYWGSPWIAHTIASWDFGEGRHLAVSIETRKEEGEAYSAVLGFFRQFELYYVVADERDVVQLRTNHRGETVRLYRLETTPEFARAVFLDYLHEINRLAGRPRWYNALTHNCTTAIRHHVQHVAPNNPFNWRILVNGRLDELGYMRGNIKTDLPFDEVRRRADITERARAADRDPDFSLRIRTR